MPPRNDKNGVRIFPINRNLLSCYSLKNDHTAVTITHSVTGGGLGGGCLCVGEGSAVRKKKRKTQRSNASPEPFLSILSCRHKKGCPRRGCSITNNHTAFFSQFAPLRGAMKSKHPRQQNVPFLWESSANTIVPTRGRGMPLPYGAK